VDAVEANTAPVAVALPAPLPGYERWVFIDGWFAPDLSNYPAESCATLLDARDAGKNSRHARCGHRHEGVDFALARINGARGDEVLHIAPPDRREREHRTRVRRQRRGRARHVLSARAGASRGRRSCASSNGTERRRGGLAVNAAFDLALRGDATSITCRAAESRRYRERLRHADRARRRSAPTYRCAPSTLGGSTSRSTMLVKLAGAPRAATHRGQHRQWHQTHDVFAESIHSNSRHVTRELYRGIAPTAASTLQRQDDRA
jgi:hypothetical protein